MSQPVYIDYDYYDEYEYDEEEEEEYEEEEEEVYVNNKIPMKSHMNKTNST